MHVTFSFLDFLPVMPKLELVNFAR